MIKISEYLFLQYNDLIVLNEAPLSDISYSMDANLASFVRQKKNVGLQRLIFFLVCAHKCEHITWNLLLFKL